MTGKIAIIGRPNVGKSTLFNRLIGRKLALVDDLPGVTRDRREGEARLGDLNFTVIDTAGLEEGDPATLAGRMRAQTEAALADCDVILFLVDARAGVTSADRYFAQAVRRADRPIILIANKAEANAAKDGVNEAYALGLGEPIAFSAEHGEGMDELYDALKEALPATSPSDVDEDEETEPPVLGDEEDGSEDDPTKALRIAVLAVPTPASRRCSTRFSAKTGCSPGPSRD